MEIIWPSGKELIVGMTRKAANDAKSVNAKTLRRSAFA